MTVLLSYRRHVLTMLAMLGASIPLGSVFAQQYPQRPIRLIVPFPAGGGADVLARTVAQRVSERLGQSIVVDNRPGAGGNIGADAVAKSDPDGYTLLYGTNGTHAINKSLYKTINFDPVKDFVPISRLTEISLMLVVSRSMPANSVQELVQYLKANPGKVNYASAGVGTSSHLAGELFKSLTGTDIMHVPFRGGASAINELVGDRVPMMIEVMPSAYPHVQGGALRGLAVTTAGRFPPSPEIPTFREGGLPAMQITAWDGIFAPAGTPKAIVDRLAEAIQGTLKEPAMIAALRSRGADPVASTPESFAQFVISEGRRWADIVEKSGAKVE